MSKTSKYNKDTPEDNINVHEGGDINLIFELFGKKIEHNINSFSILPALQTRLSVI